MKKIYLILALLGLLWLASCNSNNQKTDETVQIPEFEKNVVSNTNIVTQKEIIKKEVLDIADLKNHNPYFNIITVMQEGYWYSRYNLGQLMARAWFGEKMILPAGAIPKMMAMIDGDFDLEKFKSWDFSYWDGNHFMPPKNPYLVKTVYTSWIPSFTQKINPKDLATLRWDSSKMDKNYTWEAFGWMILKEWEWAKNFHNEGHFGKVTDPRWAQWRMTWMILTNEAKAQTKNYVSLKKQWKIRMNERDKIVMLEALSSIYSLTSNKEKYPLTYDEKYSSLVMSEAGKLYEELKNIKPSNLKNASLMVQASVWYLVKVKKDIPNLNTDLKKYINNLLTYTPKSATEKAYMIRWLVEWQRLLNANLWIDKLFTSLVKEYDWENGYFKSQTKYSIDDIWSILWALNALNNFPQNWIDKKLSKKLFVSVFESMVNLSGLMKSTPPVASWKDKWEYEGIPDINFGYPTIPKPPMAWWKFWVAPVFAWEVEFNPETSSWKVSDERFYTAGGMHAANEMIWFHKAQVNWFPEFN